MASIKIIGKTTHLGNFHDEEEAARKYDEAAAPLGRPLNFPGEGQAEVVTGADQAVKQGSSSYKGVSWDSKSNKWKAQIRIDGKVAYLGYFHDDEEAARKYDEAAAPLGKPLNFPGEGQDKAVKRGSSKYKGVSWYIQKNKWMAQIWIDGKHTHLGYFHDEEEAARNYDDAAAPLGRKMNVPRKDRAEALKEGKGDSSRDEGVSWDSQDNKWKAPILIDGKRTFLGDFHDEEEAARKYDEAAAPLGRQLNYWKNSGGGSKRNRFEVTQESPEDSLVAK